MPVNVLACGRDGHRSSGVGFAAKRIAPDVPLALLLVGATLLDILWSTFILLGLEHARIVPGITAASPLDLYDYPICRLRRRIGGLVRASPSGRACA